MKRAIIVLMLIFSVANASFLKHAMAIGTGIAIGHAASKAIDYEVKKHQDKNIVQPKKQISDQPVSKQIPKQQATDDDAEPQSQSDSL